jgi:hypothetical protein
MKAQAVRDERLGCRGGVPAAGLPGRLVEELLGQAAAPVVPLDGRG